MLVEKSTIGRIHTYLKDRAGVHRMIQLRQQLPFSGFMQASRDGRGTGIKLQDASDSWHGHYVSSTLAPGLANTTFESMTAVT